MPGVVDAVDGVFGRMGAVLRRYARPIRDALVLVGLLRAGWYYVVQGIWPWTFIGIDARAYWGINLAHPYAAGAVGDHSAFLYSPAFALVFAPFSLLPFPVFLVLWTAILAVVCAWLLRPWPWAALILALPISYELCVGNIHVLVAAAIVAGFRAPWTTAFPALAKLTPGVGVLWWAVRREWRPLAIALGAMAALAGASFLVTPTAWFEWINLLVTSQGSSQLLVPRLVLAAGIVTVGALTGRRWLVPVAVWLSLPLVYINSWVILLAVIRLRERGDA